MGDVVAAWDRQLGRTVALKRANGPGEPERLRKEAELTALLEHPGIVPVYDAGTDRDGAPWYTMRLIRGGTLQAVLAADERPPRASLLRHLLAAAHAVGFAHSWGVLHRDLKPANLLIGEFGETQVADWGLARKEGEGAGGVVGTPGWMSPEQQRGEPGTPASDVFALGRILEEVVARTPGEGPDRELWSIQRRATAPKASARYPDAAALALDLERHADGREVKAHRYSAWDHAARLGRRWRTPLLVAAAGLLLSSAALLVGYVRTVAERDRALLAERAASTARGEAEGNLAESWVAHATAAALSGDRPAAERLALSALRLRESPEARGVLVRVDDGPRPERVDNGWQARGAVLALGPDRVVEVAPGGVRVADAEGVTQAELRLDGDPLATVLSDGSVLAWSARDPLVRWAGPGGSEERCPLPSDFHPQWIVEEAPGAPSGSLLLGRAEQVLEIGASCYFGPSPMRPCTGDAVTLSAVADQGTIVLCSDRALLLRTGPGAAWERRALPAEVPRSPARVTTWGPDELLLTTDFGRIVRLDRATLTVRADLEITHHPLVEVQAIPGVDAVVVRGDPGSVWVVRPGTGGRMRLPGLWRQVRVEGSEVVLGGARVVRWRLPGPGPGRSLDVGVGLGCLAVAADGREVVGCRGDGWLTRWNLGNGDTTAVDVAPGVVVKDGAYIDGGFVAARAGSADAAMLRFDTEWRHGKPIGTTTTRRVAALPGGRWLSLAWGRQPLRVHDAQGAELRLGPAEEQHDLSSSPDGRHVILVGPAGVTLLAAEDLDAKVPPLPGTGDVAWAVVENGGAVSVVGTGGLRRLTGGTWVRAQGDVAQPTALAADHGWLAVGELNGTLHVFRADGTLVARWSGHDARVSGLTFTGPDELVSASWDGRLRRWALGSARLDSGVLERAVAPWLEEAGTEMDAAW
jgi:hypothetical protein